jgi:GH43 family beta-xylosidase
VNPRVLTYTNPVWPGYFADPFVLQRGKDYFAYGTRETAEPRASNGASVFAILHSTDLVRWAQIGAALVPASGTEDHLYWAPEVAFRDGRYFLYYSTAPSGRDELHRLHVAVANDPRGPFFDQGCVLPENEGFSIDAHPFCDPRYGRWYLFFAKDYFEERTGTGIAVVPLASDMLRAVEPSRPVLRANADWQIYERNRSLYGRQWTAWHTVEGPCIVAHGGRYYCFYSGGNWQTNDYGMSYAVADHPLGPWRHAPESDPIVLRQRDEHALGPGHNSYAIAPDGRTEVLVYHAWDPARSARRMCIDPLVWTAEGPRCNGPTSTPQTLG